MCLAALAGQTPGTAALSGVVTDRSSGQPIPDAVVSLRIQGQPGRAAQQATDGKGRFVFDELAGARQYSLEARKFGYLDGRYGEVPGQNGAQRIALADGQWLSAINIRLSKVGAIGGSVVDEFGEPVVGALVRAVAQVVVAGRPQLAAGPVAKTDDRGEYRITGLLPGRYFVMVPSVQHSVPASTTPAQIEGLGPEAYARLAAQIEQGRASPIVNHGAVSGGDARLIIGNFVTPPPSSDGRARAYPMTFHPATTSITSATVVELVDGVERSGINVSLQPVPAVRVSGRVTGLNATPRLMLRLVPAGVEGLGQGGEAATTIANGDGTFVFLSVPAGAYTLIAGQAWFGFQAEPAYMPGMPRFPDVPGRELMGRQIVRSAGGAPNGVHLSASFAPPTVTVFGRTTVTVGSADVTDVVLDVQPGRTIRGRFVYEDMPNGPPSRPFTVLAEPSDGRWSQGLALSNNEAPGADSSQFSIPAVPAGEYFLRPTAPLGTVVKSIIVGGQDHLRRPIDATAVDDITDVTITFTGRTPKLSGSVRDARGVPAEGAAVIAFPVDRTTWPNLGLNPILAKLVAASPDGTFTVATLPAGEYYFAALEASRFAEWTDPALLARIAPQATRFVLEWGASTTADLTVITVR